MNFQELLEASSKAQLLCGIVLDERRRVEWALVHFDKPGYRELSKSMLHLYFDLTELYARLENLTRKPADDTTRPYSEWFYPDHDRLDESEAHERLVRFYHMTERLFVLVRDILKVLDTIGAKDEVIHGVNKHLFLDLHFLKFDIRTVTGQEL